MAKGAVLLDCSTVDVDLRPRVAAEAEAAGLGFLDAPVSGGVGGAAAGTLTFMVGGSDDAFATARRFSRSWAQKAVHCGPAGNGQAAKICNNMILGVTMIATCEAFALADKLGLDRQAMFDVVSTSSGQFWSMNAYCPAPGIGPKSPADNDYKPGFAADLMLKDLRLSQDAADLSRCRHADGRGRRRTLPPLRRGRGRRGPRLLGHAAEVREKRPHRRHLTGRKGGSDFS
jgi:3-hydroxyisobutyrate dehydrogenase